MMSWSSTTAIPRDSGCTSGKGILGGSSCQLVSHGDPYRVVENGQVESIFAVGDLFGENFGVLHPSADHAELDCERIARHGDSGRSKSRGSRQHPVNHVGEPPCHHVIEGGQGSGNTGGYRHTAVLDIIDDGAQRTH